MPQRICVVDGEEEDIAGGRICENDHFIGKKHLFGFLGSEMKSCPVDGTKLR